MAGPSAPKSSRQISTSRTASPFIPPVLIHSGSTWGIPTRWCAFRTGTVTSRRGVSRHASSTFRTVAGTGRGTSSFLPAARKDDVPRPVPATVRKVDDACRDTPRLEVTVPVRKAHHRVGIPHVDPLWIRTGGIKGDAVRLVEICREDFGALGPAIRVQPAESADLSAAAFGDEDISVGSHTYDARCRETVRIQLDLEAVGSFWPRVGRPGDDGRCVT